MAKEFSPVNLVFENSYAEEGETENVLTVKNASLTFKCEECSYKNIFEKGLKQHRKMKHTITQTDGVDNKDLVPGISHLEVQKNWVKKKVKMFIY